MGFFAYPGKASEFYPEGCSLHQLATVEEDRSRPYRLVDALNATAVEPERIQLAKPGLVTGEFGPEAIAAAVGHFLPTNAIVVDESATSGAFWAYDTSI